MILYRLTRKLIRDPKHFFSDFINNRRNLKIDTQRTIFALLLKLPVLLSKTKHAFLSFLD